MVEKVLTTVGFFYYHKRYMKKLFLILCIFMACPVFGADYRAAMVANMDTGQILYQENATVANYPASLTKIMTLYLTFDALSHGRLQLDDYLIVSQSAADASPVKLWLKAGSKIKVEDAIKAVAVFSANDVARVLAENLKGGQEESFADLMTRVAAQIGLSDTHFENSSGLPNDDHMSTARDIALLSMAVYKHFPQYWKYFGIKSWTYNGKTYTNGNRLLATYAGCDGMKTGYTNKSKYSLVATAERNGSHLISVVLGAASKDVRANTATRLLNNGFNAVGAGTVVATTVNTAPAITSSASTFTSAYKTATGATVSQHSTSSVSSAYSVATGNAGVQFGAFASRGSAQTQAANVKAATGMSPVIESAPNGMFRVRVNNVSESTAAKLKSSALNAGIDCYIFH